MKSRFLSVTTNSVSPPRSLFNGRKQALAQDCGFCSPLCAQKPCYGLTVAAPSNCVVCKVKTWLSPDG
jgi:hypothetical protein